MLSSIFWFLKSFSNKEPIEEKEWDRKEWETYLKERNRQNESRHKWMEEHPRWRIDFRRLEEPKGKCPQDIRDKYK